MRRHSLGAMPLSRREDAAAQGSPVKKWSSSRDKGLSPRPKGAAAAGHAGRGAELRKRVSELEQTIAWDKSLDDIEAELLAAYASLLAAADLGCTSKYEARVEELTALPNIRNEPFGTRS